MMKDRVISVVITGRRMQSSGRDIRWLPSCRSGRRYRPAAARRAPFRPLQPAPRRRQEPLPRESARGAGRALRRTGRPAATVLRCSTRAPSVRRSWPSVTTVSSPLRPVLMTREAAQRAVHRPQAGPWPRRRSTAKTIGPFWPVCTASRGTTTAFGSVRMTSRTSQSAPGQSTSSSVVEDAPQRDGARRRVDAVVDDGDLAVDGVGQPLRRGLHLRRALRPARRAVPAAGAGAPRRTRRWG